MVIWCTLKRAGTTFASLESGIVQGVILEAFGWPCHHKQWSGVGGDRGSHFSSTAELLHDLQQVTHFLCVSNLALWKVDNTAFSPPLCLLDCEQIRAWYVRAQQMRWNEGMIMSTLLQCTDGQFRRALRTRQSEVFRYMTVYTGSQYPTSLKTCRWKLGTYIPWRHAPSSRRQGLSLPPTRPLRYHL